MTRLQATVALLQAWLDYAPHPETWTGELQRRSTNSGPAPFRRVVCEECEGRGKTKSGWMCSTCKGRGRYDVDDYTLEIVDSSITPWSQLLQRFVTCSTCGGWGRLSADSNTRPSNEHPFCDECNGTGKVPAPFSGVFRFDNSNTLGESSGDATLDALARNEERRESVPIYRDHLLPALHDLKTLDRYGHFLVQWVWILGAQSPLSLPARGTVRLINGTRAIEAVLPDRFEKQLPGEIRAQHDHQQAMRSRVNGWAQAKGRGVNGKQLVRDADVVKLYATGSWTQAQLAEKFGVGQQAISKILKKGAT